MGGVIKTTHLTLTPADEAVVASDNEPKDKKHLTGFFQYARDALAAELAKIRNRQFMEATMTGRHWST